MKPTLEEVRNFITENKLEINAIDFYEYYQKRGWCIQGDQIQNWKGIAIQWSKDPKRKYNTTPKPTSTPKDQYDLYKKWGLPVPKKDWHDMTAEEIDEMNDEMARAYEHKRR